MDMNTGVRPGGGLLRYHEEGFHFLLLRVAKECMASPSKRRRDVSISALCPRGGSHLSLKARRKSPSFSCSSSLWKLPSLLLQRGTGFRGVWRRSSPKLKYVGFDIFLFWKRTWKKICAYVLVDIIQPFIVFIYSLNVSSIERQHNLKLGSSFPAGGHLRQQPPVGHLPLEALAPADLRQSGVDGVSTGSTKALERRVREHLGPWSASLGSIFIICLRKSCSLALPKTGERRIN